MELFKSQKIKGKESRQNFNILSVEIIINL